MTLTAFLSALRRYWPYVVIAGLLVALLLTRATLAGQKLKTAQTQAAFDQTVAGFRAAALEREKSDLINVSRVQGESATISKETTDDYEARIAQLRADFSERVRREAKADTSGTAATNLPQLSDGPSGTDARTCEAEFPAQDALIASEQAEQLVALQKWVRETAAIDVNGVP